MPLMVSDATAASRTGALSRDAIVGAALRVTAEYGTDGLTMRAVGQQLGVSAMALYHHLRNKDELIELVASEVLAGVVPLHLDTDGWEGSLRRHLRSLLEQQARYPGINRLLFERPMLGTNAGQVSEGVEFFVRAGFDESQARLAWTFMITYAHGRLSVEANLRGVDAGDHRHAEFSSADYVAYGIEATIAGIAALGPRTSARGPRGYRS
jgi:AcrR family transcriptional regulator